MKKKKKGRDAEVAVKGILEYNQYKTDQKNYSRWQSKDFFNLYDILALSKKDIRLIQVKTNLSHVKKARTSILNWLHENEFYETPCKHEVWLEYKVRNRFRVWQLSTKAEWVELTDIRQSKYITKNNFYLFV